MTAFVYSSHMSKEINQLACLYIRKNGKKNLKQQQLQVYSYNIYIYFYLVIFNKVCNKLICELKDTKNWNYKDMLITALEGKTNSIVFENKFIIRKKIFWIYVDEF